MADIHIRIRKIDVNITFTLDHKIIPQLQLYTFTPLPKGLFDYLQVYNTPFIIFYLYNLNADQIKPFFCHCRSYSDGSYLLITHAQTRATHKHTCTQTRARLSYTMHLQPLDILVLAAPTGRRRVVGYVWGKRTLIRSAPEPFDPVYGRQVPDPLRPPPLYHAHISAARSVGRGPSISSARARYLRLLIKLPVAAPLIRVLILWINGTATPIEGSSVAGRCGNPGG